jgi:hypothetical protein
MPINANKRFNLALEKKKIFKGTAMAYIFPKNPYNY